MQFLWNLCTHRHVHTHFQIQTHFHAYTNKRTQPQQQQQQQQQQRMCVHWYVGGRGIMCAGVYGLGGQGGWLRELKNLYWRVRYKV